MWPQLDNRGRHLNIVQTKKPISPFNVAAVYHCGKLEWLVNFVASHSFTAPSKDYREAIYYSLR